MNGLVLYPNSGAMEGIELIRTAFAGCIVNLFQNQISISPSLKVEELEAADFTGYAPKTVAALLPSYLDPAGGASAAYRNRPVPAHRRCGCQSRLRLLGGSIDG